MGLCPLPTKFEKSAGHRSPTLHKLVGFVGHGALSPADEI